jgi:hypothetical protein
LLILTAAYKKYSKGALKEFLKYKHGLKFSKNNRQKTNRDIH